MYDLNVLIKSKRPALVRCSNGKRGGFCCYKDTNNHLIIQTFKQKKHEKVTCAQKKVDATYLRLLRWACWQSHLAQSYKDEGGGFLEDEEVCFLKHAFYLLHAMG